MVTRRIISGRHRETSFVAGHVSGRAGGRAGGEEIRRRKCFDLTTSANSILHIPDAGGVALLAAKKIGTKGMRDERARRVMITLGRRVRERERERERESVRATYGIPRRSFREPSSVGGLLLGQRNRLGNSFDSRDQPRFTERERGGRGVARPSVDAFDPGSRGSPLIAFRSTRPRRTTSGR